MPLVIGFIFEPFAKKTSSALYLPSATVTIERSSSTPFGSLCGIGPPATVVMTHVHR